MNYGYQYNPNFQQGQFNQNPQMQPLQYSPQYMQSMQPMDRLAQLQAEAQARDQSNQLNNYPSFKLILVGSVEEAKGFLSPPDGSKIFFLNSSNNEVYSKQLDFSTGKSIFLTYKLSDINDNTKKEEETENKNYILREEFDGIKKDFSELKKEINKIKKEIKEKDTEEEED